MNKVVNGASLSTEIDGPIDLFICSVSFEDRCFSSAQALDVSRISNSIIYSYPEFRPHNDKNLEVLKDVFGGKAHVYELDNSDSIKTADEIVKSLSDFGVTDEHKILLDVTTFTRESLLIILKVFYLNMPMNMPTLIYNSAKDMSNEWLSKGLKECRSILGYAGDFSSNKPLHLIVLLGFEPERARNIIDMYEPTVLSVGTGASGKSITNDFHAENRKFLAELHSYYEEILDPFELSLKDPVEAMVSLQEQIDKHPGCNVVIAPLNNKLSTIACGMLANKCHSVQLCYSQVELYNFDDYSTPSDLFYLVDEY